MRIVGVPVLLLFLILLLSSCAENYKNSILQTNNLALQRFDINIKRDTVIMTKGGMMIDIPKGRLESDSNLVQLNIREALSVTDIVNAGLTTTSNGKLLTSAGMLYFAAENESVKIAKPLKAIMPTESAPDDNMQLFQGVENDGQIDWTKPDTIPASSRSGLEVQGKILFDSKCASCHLIDRVAVGPALAHYPKRLLGPQAEGFGEDANEFIRNPAAVMANSCYFQKMKAMYGSMMQAFPALSDSDLLAIATYVQNESDRLSLPYPDTENLKACIDSCKVYVASVREIDRQLRELNSGLKDLISKNGPMVNQDTPGFITQRAGQSTESMRDMMRSKVSPQNFNATYYQFEIANFGWHNIDAFLDDQNSEESRLSVLLTGKITDRVQIYLIIPAYKVFTEAGPLDGSKAEYGFYETDGTLPLPQHAKAWILALHEADDKIAFALHPFKTVKSLDISIALEYASKDEFANAMKKLERKGLNVNVADALNADSIRKLDTNRDELEKQLKAFDSLKPANCNCDCFLQGNDSLESDHSNVDYFAPR